MGAQFQTSRAAEEATEGGLIRRNAAIDLLRTLSVVSIIFLHVTLSNLGRLAWAPGNDLYYKAATVLGSIYSNETLVFISLLLALSNYDRNSFRPYLLSRLARIGIPFLAFSIFYVALDAVWLRQGVFFRFTPAESIVLILVAGLAEYHLHFLPALLVLVAILPVFRRACSLPVILMLLMVASSARFTIEYLVIGNASVSQLTAAQLLLLHLGKLIAYFPYGFLAQWFATHSADLYLRHARRNPTLWLILLLAAIVILDLSVMASPDSAARGPLAFGVVVHELLGTALAVAGIFLGFACAASGKDRANAIHAEFYSRAFLVLMIHPVFLRLFTRLVPAQQANIAFDLLCAAFVLSVSFAVAGLLKPIGAWIWNGAITARSGPSSPK